MAQHSLRVGVLHTDVTAASAHEEATLRRGYDRAISEHLPAVMSELATPVLDRHDGVVRLRRLRVRLEHVGALDEPALARLVAARITAALAEALARSSTDVLRWPDHAAYLAAYVEMKLGIAPAQSWPFVELAPLDLLTPSEAAVEVLHARPQVLVTLAANGARFGEPDRAVAALDEQACTLLIDRLLAGSPGVASMASIWAVAADAATTPEGRRGPAQFAVALLLRALASSPSADAVVVLPRAAAVVSGLHALVRGLHSRGRAIPDTEQIRSVLASPDRALPPAIRESLEGTLADPLRRTALESVLDVVASRPTRVPRKVEEEGVAERAAAGSRVRVLASPVAGTVLLLPGVQRVGARPLAPHQLRAAVLSTLGGDIQRSAATDSLLAVMFPSDPHAEIGELPPLPRRAVEALAHETTHLLVAEQGPRAWGDLLLADFAGRLPGLRSSSREWLQRQFLHVPGRLELSDEEATVILEGPALSVVLAMAGLDGSQGELPHLGGRRLRIVLGGPRA